MEADGPRYQSLDKLSGKSRRVSCCCTVRRDDWSRPTETPVFGVVSFVAEFWNTLSNFAFILFGLVRLIEIFASDDSGDRFMIGMVLYGLYTLAGCASAFHHAAPLNWRRWTIVIDWIPISSSILTIICWPACWPLLLNIRTISWVKVGIALLTLLSDHICLVLPVPVGHALWHILIAYATNNLYDDMLRSPRC